MLRLNIVLILLASGVFLSYGQDVKKVEGNFYKGIYRPSDGLYYAFHYDNTTFQNLGLAAVDVKFGKIVQNYPQLAGWTNTMLLSKNQQYLYLGKTDSIARFNLLTHQVDMVFASQMPTTELVRPVQMAELPAQPNSLVVYWNYGYYAEAHIGVYDNGVLRPDVSHTLYQVSQFTVSENGQYLYGYDGFTTGTNLTTLKITPTGLTNLQNSFHYIKEFTSGSQIFQNRLYGFEGTVIGIEQDTNLNLLARLTYGGYLLKIGANSDTLYFARNNSGTSLELLKYHKTNFQLLSRSTLIKMPSGVGFDQFTPLNEGESYALFSGNTLYIARNCQSQIAAPPAFSTPFIYHCNGDSVTIVAPGSYPDDRYYWSNNQFGRQQKFYDYQDYSVSYRIMDAQGCMSAASPPLQVKIVQKPAAPSIETENGNSVVCQGGFLDLKARSVWPTESGAVQFLWSTGETQQNIRITSAGTYKCRVRSPEGCLSADNGSGISVYASTQAHPPKPNIEIVGGDGDALVCSGDMAIAKLPDGYAGYRWKDLQIFTQSLPITRIMTLQATVSNAAGCVSEYSDPIDIQYFITPPKPSIVKAGSVLSSSEENNNQWFLNGNPINGATNQIYQATQSGTYTVRIIPASGCASEMSDPVQF